MRGQITSRALDYPHFSSLELQKIPKPNQGSLYKQQAFFTAESSLQLYMIQFF